MQASDSVTMRVRNQETTAFESFECSSSIYEPAGSWNAVLHPDVEVDYGDQVRILINGRTELTGIVDVRERTYDGASNTKRISGRSLIGLLQDTCITDFKAPPSTLTAAAKKYLASIPYVNRCAIEFADEASDANTHHHAADVGDTVFRLLSEYALNRGLILWAKPDGTIVFGKVIRQGKPAFQLNASNILRGREIRDCKGLHSSIMLVSDGKDGHQKATATNTTAPLEKPFIACYNGFKSDLEGQAGNYIRQEKMQSLQLEYVVRGFSQNGANWAVNTLVRTQDDILGYTGTYVLNRRSFSFSRTTGSLTTLALGPILEDPFVGYHKHSRHIRARGAL